MMKQYYVYSHDPEKLNGIGTVYHPRIKMSYVILTTDKELHEVRGVDGVYEVRECKTGKQCI